MNKYVIYKSSEGNKRVDEWFNKCQNESIPYITIEQKNKYSKVTFNHISYEPEIDKILGSNSEIIFPSFIKIFKRYATKKSNYFGSALYMEFREIPNEHSEQLAREIYDYVNSIVLANTANVN